MKKVHGGVLSEIYMLYELVNGNWDFLTTSELKSAAKAVAKREAATRHVKILVLKAIPVLICSEATGPVEL